MTNLKRRDTLKILGATALGTMAGPAVAFDPLKTNGRRVVIIGAGFGGSIAAKTIRIADPSIEVVLIDRNTTYTMCPGSNLVIGGSRQLSQNSFIHDELVYKYGIRFIQEEVTAIDGSKKSILGKTGSLAYDRLIVAPGISFRFDEISGYDAENTPKSCLTRGSPENRRRCCGNNWKT